MNVANPVVQLQDRPAAQEFRLGYAGEPLRFCVVDRAPNRLRTGSGREGHIERPVGGGEIAPHVQRRDPLLGRHDVEAPRVRLAREQFLQVLSARVVEPQQIHHRVAVLEPGQPAKRRALSTAHGETRRDQRALERCEGRLGDRRVRLRGRLRRHLPTRDPRVDLLPRAERLVVRQVIAELREVERRRRPAGRGSADRTTRPTALRRLQAIGPTPRRS